MSETDTHSPSLGLSEAPATLGKGKERRGTPDSKEEAEVGAEAGTERLARKSVTIEDGSGSEDEDDEEDSAETSDAGKKEGQQDVSSGSEPAQAQGWQAIFSPQHNAYYFFNSITQETTWVNPMQPQPEASGSGSASGSEPPTNASASSITEPAGQEPEASTSASTPAAISHYSALQAAAIAQGIDPALAHLDPSLLSSVPGRPADASGIPMFTAKFNKHTGAFAKNDARDPSHLSEFERAKRMSEFYFDVGAWENQLAEHGGSIRGGDDAQTGEKRKRLTKKDMERFKEQKKAKKLAKTAWLRN
ncbi:hypothetical protein BKA70DRAFT_1155621 [Coprinopsis sp. MPI-PUGE-AT-0042]|nr:hypothetical protein BKA70DRAFT_1155621 [Coprinopsis sp. MPI-PUGE-AT-0042]